MTKTTKIDKAMIGKRFGKLTLIAETDERIRRHRVVICRCDCGNDKKLPLISLTKNTRPTQSCGVGVCKFHKHKMSGTKTYRAWVHMLHRCYNKNNCSYKHYGARGINVCNEWKEFNNFLNDMGAAPVGCSIERIDNSKSYYKGNCRWATSKEQASNRRSNINYSFNGITQTLKQWCEIKNVNYKTVHNRIRTLKWTFEKALGL